MFKSSRGQRSILLGCSARIIRQGAKVMDVCEAAQSLELQLGFELASGEKTFRPRKSYSREQKLEVLKWHKENGSKSHKTTKHFGLNSKMIIRWVKDEQKIIDSKEGSLRVEFAKTAAKRREIDSQFLADTSRELRSAAATDAGSESLDLLGLPKYSTPHIKPKIQSDPAPFELSFSETSASPLTQVENNSTPPPVKRARHEEGVRGRDEGVRTEDVLTKILSEVNSTSRSGEVTDEDGLFGLQVSANLRRLTSRQKATAKIKIQQVLLEIEFPSDS